MKTKLLALFFGTLCGHGYCAEPMAHNYPGWHDTHVVRVSALALVQTLNAELLANSSATKTLQSWCQDHNLAESEKIRAEVVEKNLDAQPLNPEIRTMLKAGPKETIAFRRVRLVCGVKVLSEADNWYIPGRLSEKMNQQLNNTDTPFGIAVSELGFYRRNQSAELLWETLPYRWFVQMPQVEHPADPIKIPDVILRHHALLYAADNQPFSYVVESYTRDNLAFPLNQGIQ